MAAGPVSERNQDATIYVGGLDEKVPQAFLSFAHFFCGLYITDLLDHYIESWLRINILPCSGQWGSTVGTFCPSWTSCQCAHAQGQSHNAASRWFVNKYLLTTRIVKFTRWFLLSQWYFRIWLCWVSERGWCWLLNKNYEHDQAVWETGKSKSDFQI